MPLTPLEIHNKEFKKVFRGYDEEEVDEFLDQVINSYEALYKENISLKEQVANKESDIGHYKNLEETLKQTLVVAQQTSDDMKQSAAKEAELVVKEAGVKAAQAIGESEETARKIVSEARDKANRISREYEDIQKQLQVFRAKFRSFLEGQLALINDEDHELFGSEGFVSVNDSPIMAKLEAASTEQTELPQQPEQPTNLSNSLEEPRQVINKEVIF